jgi:hypothetical protein
MPNDLPTLTTESTKRVDVIAADLRARLLGMSEQIAGANKHDNIQCSDVNKALFSLKQAGLEDPPPPPPPTNWMDRPTTHIGIGSMVFGLAPSVSGFALNLLSLGSSPVLFCLCVIAIPCILAGVGATLAVLGFMRAGA